MENTGSQKMLKKTGNQGRGVTPQQQQKGHKGSSKQRHFSDHLSLDQIKLGLDNFSLFAGKLKVFPKKRKVGYVEIEGFTVDVLIEDEQQRNRAFVGDIVVVELFEENKWKLLADGDASTAVSVEEASVSMSALEVKDHTDELWRPRQDLLQAYHQDLSPPLDLPETPESKAHQVINEAACTSRKQPTGRVVGILAPSPRGHCSILGALTLNTPPAPGSPLSDSVSYCFFKPANAAYPFFIVPRIHLPDAFRADPSSFLSHIFLLDASSLWPASSKFPYGESVRTMGEVGSIQAETTALLVEHDLNHSVFSDEILESLNAMLHESGASVSSGDHCSPSDLSFSSGENWAIPEEEIARRLDLRSTRIFTIDPSGAKDLDDALHITPLESSCCSYEVGVHIADVSYFVREGTALDKEAFHRATSVYLVQKVIPMLPPLLCEQLCSLNPNVDRLAFSCIFRMTANGCLCDKHQPFYGKTVIRSCAKLDYATAQRMVDGEVPSTPSSGVNQDAHIDELPEEVWEQKRRPPLGCGQKAWEIARDVCLLHKVAMPRRAQRMAHGSLSLNNPKITFRLDGEGNPISSSPYEIKESNQLIEEYMLLANYLVAEKLVETVGRCGFLRCHPSPSPDGLENLVALASKIGYHVDISSARTLQQSLKEISLSASPVVTQAITSLMMLPMTSAKYFVIDKSPAAAWNHYALAIPYYTHFTSPIRRYADVMVHRFLLEGLKLEKQSERSGHGHRGGGKSGIDQLQRRYPFSKLHEIAEHCNMRKKSAHDAQVRSDEVYLGVYLSRYPRPQAKAVVVGVGEKSFSVLVLDFSLMTRIFLDKTNCISLPESTYDKEAEVLTLRQKATGKELQVTYMTPVYVRMYASSSPPPITVEVALAECSFE